MSDELIADTLDCPARGAGRAEEEAGNAARQRMAATRNQRFIALLLMSSFSILHARFSIHQLLPKA
jgi:hypothetical protein